MRVRAAGSLAFLSLAVMSLARPALALPSSAAPAQQPSAPALTLPPASPAEFTRVRATGKGLVLGTLIGATAGAILLAAACSVAWEPGRPAGDPCNSSGRYFVAAAVGGGLGAALGATIGGAISRRKPSSYQASWWESAHGEIGGAFVHFGGNRVLGQEGASLARAFRVGFLLQLGPFFAFGPEFASYVQRVPDSARFLGPSGQPEPDLDRTAIDLAIAARVLFPVGRLSPYLLGSYGRLAHFGQGYDGGGLGIGAEWRVLSRLGIGAESRLHVLRDRSPRTFVDATVGTTVHW